MYDLVVYGATGFTGRLVSRYLGRHAPAGLRWAIVGRSQAKLESELESLSTFNTPPASLIAVKDADTSDATAARVATSARVVLSTAGPFSLYSDKVVAACARQGTSYVDINGEVPWVKRVIERDAKIAADSGAIIVPNAGFDSTPSDIGAMLAARSTTNATDLLGLVTFQGRVSGGTIATGILMNQTFGDEIQQPFLLGGGPGLLGVDHADPTQPWLFDVKASSPLWLAPFGMAPINTRVVRRSASLRGDVIRYREFAVAPSEEAARKMAKNAFVPPEKLQALVEAGRLPKPSEGPDDATRASSSFELRVVNADTGDWLASVAGGDPGYDETAKMVAEAALGLLVGSRDVLPCRGEGGVWTPSTALGDVLVERLRGAGMVVDF